MPMVQAVRSTLPNIPMLSEGVASSVVIPGTDAQHNQVGRQLSGHRHMNVLLLAARIICGPSQMVFKTRLATYSVPKHKPYYAFLETRIPPTIS
jgi:hypothetical protein